MGHRAAVWEIRVWVSKRKKRTAPKHNTFQPLSNGQKILAEHCYPFSRAIRGLFDCTLGFIVRRECVRHRCYASRTGTRHRNCLAIGGLQTQRRSCSEGPWIRYISLSKWREIRDSPKRYGAREWAYIYVTA